MPEYKKYRGAELKRFVEFVEAVSQKNASELAKIFALGSEDTGRRIWNDLKSGNAGSRIRPDKFRTMLHVAKQHGWDSPDQGWAAHRWKLENRLRTAEGRGCMLTRAEFEARESRFRRDNGLPEDQRRKVRWLEARAQLAEQKAATLRAEAAALIDLSFQAAEQKQEDLKRPLAAQSF